MALKKFRVGDIQPNPFRHLDRYPIKREKVEALRESLRSTGFWDNVVARIGESGKPEIAYGHHRLVALKEEFGVDAQVSLILRKLDDEVMLKIMAQENMEEWATRAEVVQETLRTVVEAYADGHIKLERPDKKAPKSSLIYAPSFIPACGPPDRTTSTKPYTLKSLGSFLGWNKPSGKPKDRLLYGMAALQAIEGGCLNEDEIAGLTISEIAAVIREGGKAKGRREQRAQASDKQAIEAEKSGDLDHATSCRDYASQMRADSELAEKYITRKVAAGMKSGDITPKNAAQEALRLDYPQHPRPKELPDIHFFLEEIAKAVYRTLESDKIEEQFRELIKFKQHIDPAEVSELQLEFKFLGDRAYSHAKELEAEDQDVGDFIEGDVVSRGVVMKGRAA